MNWVDLVILAVLAISAITAFFNGIVVEIFSLGGLIVGFLVAAARYDQLAPHLPQWLDNVAHGEIRSLVAFLVIAIAIMLAAWLLGQLLRKTVRVAGLGVFDRLLGAVFGLIKGFVVVTLVVMAVMAFFPKVEWPSGSRLAPVFVRAAHDGSRVTAADFGTRIRQGIQFFRAPVQAPSRGVRANRAEAGKAQNE